MSNSRRPDADGAAVTEADLRAAGLRYVARYAASRRKVEHALVRHVRRVSGAAPSGDVQVIIERCLNDFVAAGYIDEPASAASAVRRLRASGRSRRFIEAKLAAAGYPAEVVADAFDGEDSDVDGDAEWRAACTFARKHRLGPFQSAGAPDAERARGLARMARAGFPYEIVRRLFATDACTPDGDDAR